MGIRFAIQYDQTHDLKATMRNFLYPNIFPIRNIFTLLHCLLGRGGACALM